MRLLPIAKARGIRRNVFDDTNYICYRLILTGKLKSYLLKQKKRYGYTLEEIAQELNISPETVDYTFYNPAKRSLNATCLIYELFKREQQQEVVRGKMLER